MIAVWFVDYRTIGTIGYAGYIVSIGLLVAVLFTPKLNGASSWFNIGNFFLFQPAELMKIVYILVVGKFLDFVYSKDKEGVNKWYNLLIVLGIMALPVALICLQPDFGSAMVFVVITAFMLFRAKIKYKYIVAILLIVVAIMPIVYFFGLNGTQKERIHVFLDPELDPLGSGYHSIQSKLAIGSGMITGMGLLNGTQTQFGYLLVKSSDFIFAVICEEMGFIVGALVIIIYIVILLKMIKIASSAKDYYGSIIVVGIAAMLFFHIVENIGMTMGILPITGIPLPFLSYGGSSMIINLIALGIVLNVSARRQKALFVE